MDDESTSDLFLGCNLSFTALKLWSCVIMAPKKYLPVKYALFVFRSSNYNWHAILNVMYVHMYGVNTYTLVLLYTVQ